jgi:nitrogenase-stabilizing/protective protein
MQSGLRSQLTTDFADKLKALSSAEDFLRFFGLEYDERVVHVNRLHILKRFFQYLQREPGLASLDELDLYRSYRRLLQAAYQDFVSSSAQREKVFKVFQDTDGQSHVSLAGLRASMPSQTRSAQAQAA